ncbi:MAG: prepilin-type N-terminal cleavage/methylation domain-containing protein [Sedimentisphaerales bacterium]|nr:prepilin-type N-terminal cleavage/methylation domain-containing protein [Sedimentisphaerales bacterium]
MKIHRKYRAFTLIELLVVIAIIGILLAILIPSLRLVKEIASVANCLANQKGLAQGYIMYAENNDDNFCSGYVFADVQDRNPPSWVKAPLIYNADKSQTYVGTDPVLLTQDARLNGIREGAIFPYVESEELYHCPGDRRLIKGTSRRNPSNPLSMYQCFRSYGMPDFYNIHVDRPQDNERKLSNVATPGHKLMFVEDQYDLYYNVDAWSYIPNDQALWDPLGNYHNKSCTFAFADGHAEHHKWRDERTMVYMSDRALAEQMGFGKGVVFNPRNVDLDWLDAHYPAKTRYKGGN